MTSCLKIASVMLLKDFLTIFGPVPPGILSFIVRRHSEVMGKYTHCTGVGGLEVRFDNTATFHLLSEKLLTNLKVGS